MEQFSLFLKVVMEGDPNEVFFSNNQMLRSLKLKPPINSQISAELNESGFPRVSNWNTFNKQIILNDDEYAKVSEKII
ncbi:hypothetical protein V7147_23315 [Bacillus sp. JJ1521]|uniref:hypothetical protein n=1 Tax=Bacillus sp. JJ1521 TaxID=3122957 RepID=UPI0030006365